MVDMVEVREVWKRFDTIQAVRGITLSIPRGSLLGLIGPNGAGKTSLLKMIATLSKPDRGSIAFLGRPVDRAVGPIRRKLGYMPAEFGRLPDMTVAEYLSYFGAAAGVPSHERRQRVEDVLALVDLVERRDSLVSAGSTGIKQRILIAKTLVHDPDLLVLDEPSAGLDPRARVEIREILVELNRLGKTIIVSSHILADLEEICDRVAIIEHGQLVAHGTIAELTDALRSRTPEATGWRLRVRRDQLEAAHELLLALPTVQAVQREEDGLRFQTQGSDANDVLAAVIQADLAVLGFQQAGPRLEDGFMTQTDGTIL